MSFSDNSDFQKHQPYFGFGKSPILTDDTKWED